MKRGTALWALAFALGAGTIAWGILADARASRLGALLARIDAAERTLTYTGTRLLTGGKNVELRVWSDRGVRRFERTSGRRVRRALPAFLRPGRDLGSIKDPALAVRNYEVISEGRESVCGRPTDVFLLRPRHPGRASYRLWADAEKRLPLRFEVRDEKDRRVHESAFTKIEFPASIDVADRWEPPSWLEFEREEISTSRLSDRAGFAVWAPARLPAGFKLSRSHVIRLHANIPEEFLETVRQFLPETPARVEGAVARLDYTDGMAVLSVVEFAADSMFARIGRRFLAGAPKAAPGEPIQARRFAEPHRQSAAYVMEIDGTVIFVAGTVSPGEMEKMIPTFERR